MPGEFLIFLEVIVPNVSNVIRIILENIVGEYISDIESRGDVPGGPPSSATGRPHTSGGETHEPRNAPALSCPQGHTHAHLVCLLLSAARAISSGAYGGVSSPGPGRSRRFQSRGPAGPPSPQGSFHVGVPGPLPRPVAVGHLHIRRIPRWL